MFSKKLFAVITMSSFSPAHGSTTETVLTVFRSDSGTGRDVTSLLLGACTCPSLAVMSGSSARAPSSSTRPSFVLIDGVLVASRERATAFHAAASLRHCAIFSRETSGSAERLPSSPSLCLSTATAIRPTKAVSAPARTSVPSQPRRLTLAFSILSDVFRETPNSASSAAASTSDGDDEVPATAP